MRTTDKPSRKDKHPVLKALGTRITMRTILAWAETHGINPEATKSYSCIVEHAKKDTIDITKIMAINSIHTHHESTFKSPVDIAKKIRNYHFNSNKMLDGRLICEGKLIRIFLNKEVRQQLEKHKKRTGIYHSDLLEDLLRAYFEEIESNNNTTSRKFKATMEKTFPEFNIPTSVITTKK
jgi:hypothetical protein